MLPPRQTVRPGRAAAPAHVIRPTRGRRMVPAPPSAEPKRGTCPGREAHRTDIYGSRRPGVDGEPPSARRRTSQEVVGSPAGLASRTHVRANREELARRPMEQSVARGVPPRYIGSWRAARACARVRRAAARSPGPVVVGVADLMSAPRRSVPVVRGMARPGPRWAVPGEGVECHAELCLAAGRRHRVREGSRFEPCKATVEVLPGSTMASCRHSP